MSDRRYTPKVLHTSVDGKAYLCGDKVEGSWHDRCLSDRFARTLPLCEGCEEVKSQRFVGMTGEQKTAKTAVTFAPPTLTENMLSSPSIIDFDAGELYVSNYRRDA
jgi:hypothetical protein|tara:strand:- start:1698 stop:2015 length:318 start_codon:yes stop_codon:yes gene_type:complete